MSFLTRQSVGISGGGGGFVPTTNTYTSVVPGSGTETVPAGASQCVITVQAPGAGGRWTASVQDGGAGGGETIKTIAVAGGDKFTYAVGQPSAANGIAPGGNSTVNGTVTGGTVALVANGGAGSLLQTGGTASGGDTNTTGGNATGGTPGTSPYGAPYGGGGQGAVAPAAPGQPGITTFAYT